MMKKLLLLMTIFLVANISYAQVFSWGIKGGINSSKINFDDFSLDSPPTVSVDPADISKTDFLIDVDGTSIINPNYITVNAPTVSFTPSSYEMGYHFGLFARIKVLAVFIQPELIFSQTNATIDISSNYDDISSDLKESSANIKYNNFDIPILVGVKLGPLRLNAGPVATFKLSSDASSAKDEVNKMLKDFTAVTKTATFGGQAGVGVDLFKKLTFDVRYEFPLSKLGDDITIGGETFKTDQRQSQFIASIGWMF